jgi:hypothetical protein
MLIKPIESALKYFDGLPGHQKKYLYKDMALQGQPRKEEPERCDLALKIKPLITRRNLRP